MEDSGPGMATPEHWSDVGPLRGRLGVVEQQLQAVQARSRGSLGFMNCAKNIDVAQAGLTKDSHSQLTCSSSFRTKFFWASHGQPAFFTLVSASAPMFFLESFGLKRL